MVGARVNGRQVTFDYKIQNGDRVEIITSQNSKGPSRDWLKIIKSSQAKSKINQWFKRQFKEENIVRGKDLLRQYAKEKGIVLADYLKPGYQKKVMLKYGFRDWDSVCAAIGHGGLKEGQVVNKLKEEYEKDHPKILTDAEAIDNVSNQDKKRSNKSKGGIVVKGIHDVAVRFSKCCNPVPGDEIVGFVTRGRGVSIHRTDCINMMSMPESDRVRLIDAEWESPEEENKGQLYTTEIKIYANNRTGMFVDVSKIFLEMNIDMSSVNVKTSKNGKATISISFDIHGVAQLNKIIAKLRGIEGVIDIERTAG